MLIYDGLVRVRSGAEKGKGEEGKRLHRSGEEIVVMGAALREGLRYRLEGMGRLRWSMYQGNYLLAFPAGFVALLDIMLNICISASDIDVEY